MLATESGPIAAYHRRHGLSEAAVTTFEQILSDPNTPITGLERWHQYLFDIGEEARPVEGAVEDGRCGQARDPQCREKRTGLPPRARGVIVDPCAAPGAAVPAEQIIGHAGVVEKDEAGRIPGRRLSLPRDARGGHLRPIVLGRAYRFF